VYGLREVPGRPNQWSWPGTDGLTGFDSLPAKHAVPTAVRRDRGRGQAADPARLDNEAMDIAEGRADMSAAAVAGPGAGVVNGST
jgi:hypothetical protein